jgi:hypothetical protein
MDRRNIYAHRGLWRGGVPQNSYQAIKAAVDLGFSVETDLRVFEGRLVVSHDSPLSDALDFQNLLSLDSSFALNIKEDGLALYVESFKDWLINSRSFFFDGSVPDMYAFRKQGIAHALRLSEFEKSVPWESQYIWIDGFEFEWWNIQDLVERYSSSSKLIFVSPELHGRDYSQMWGNLCGLLSKDLDNIGICTDRPLEFLEFMEEHRGGK